METNPENNNLLARWLDKRLTKDEEKKLAANNELDALKTVIDDIDTWQLKKFDVENGLKKLQERKKATNPKTKVISLKRKTNTFWIGMAASFTLFMATSYLLFNYFFNTQITISTTIAENKTVTLPTGSIVYLDALSSISYNKKEWKNNRNIELNGQAVFNVTKGKTFKVHTPNNVNITVLGTKFNINTNKKELSVTCFEGKVAVEYNNEKEILTKGQAVFLNNDQLIQTQHQNSKPNWQQGFSKYQESTLSAIVTDLKKYYPIKIKLPKKYKDLKFSGVVPHNNLELSLKTIFTPFEIKYQIKNNTVIFM